MKARACGDARHHVLLRYGGHNQEGGGEQGTEVWTYRYAHPNPGVSFTRPAPKARA